MIQINYIIFNFIYYFNDKIISKPLFYYIYNVIGLYEQTLYIN